MYKYITVKKCINIIITHVFTFFSVLLLILIHMRKLPSRRLPIHLIILLTQKGLWGKLSFFVTWTMKMYYS